MKTTKLIVLITGILIANASIMFAQPSPVAQHFSIGLQAGQFKNDLCAGINITTPYFADKTVAIRLTANGQAFEYIPLEELNHIRSFYTTLRLGFVVRSKTGIANVLYPYMEFGGTGIIPNKNFSDKDFLIGACVLAGLEGLSKTRRMGYFVEMGFEGTEARAEKAVGSPYYAAGLHVALGWRIYIGK